MHFSATLLPALVALTSAAAVPRSTYGQWTVSATVSPDHSVYVTAKYTSDAYPDDKYMNRSCVENPFATPPVEKRCDRTDFTYEYDARSKFYQYLHLPQERGRESRR
ncbi:uncharacterized protein CC84DRAFT_1217788 [Paraphaeosphaeria sporulosa]|uniref:Uncharacterized protein n=1 Tax=Paraphaeosphaeria sporulosa TaxID=1460663 RepID=A0A177CC03_9PLEO|nr:uncharacterized protein CC84DRAFT_1217788 [Paraphaeosphaeria sporulosa]OAG04317.1 hypothetical protein CC84DRAFT_1217788 [Paraphaeosphaeria sporulosa]